MGKGHQRQDGQYIVIVPLHKEPIIRQIRGVQELATALHTALGKRLRSCPLQIDGTLQPYAIFYDGSTRAQQTAPLNERADRLAWAPEAEEIRGRAVIVSNEDGYLAGMTRQAAGTVKRLLEEGIA